jgi:putative hydrolase of the HAD superfamily
MPKAIFFDAAGTLIFLPRPVGEHYREVARRFGADIPADAMQQAFLRAWAATPPRAASPGPRDNDDKGWWRDLVERVLDQTLTREQQIAFPRAAYFEAVYAHFAEPGVWALFPEVAEVLTDLQARGYRLGVISNFDRRLDGILAGLGIRHYFECVILSSQTGADKPDPRIFRRGLEALRVEPAQALHAGDDRERDGGAEAVGIRVFHLDRPRRTLADLAGWIDGLAAERHEDLPPHGSKAK